ncbi:hypothetical protein JW887_03165 [Candidatus Dojkabacteria bacterium]|nr:hypothetical protein [Candidatus Dojkabacteria bacterium]
MGNNDDSNKVITNSNDSTPDPQEATEPQDSELTNEINLGEDNVPSPETANDEPSVDLKNEVRKGFTPDDED